MPGPFKEEETTSSSLLHRLRQPGDTNAWNRFFELYHPLLTAWAEKWGRRRGLSDSDIDDLIGEVFLVLVKKLPAFTYDPAKPFRGWLHHLVQNIGCDLLRRRNRLPATGQDLALLEVADEESSRLFEEQDYRRNLVEQALPIIQRDFAPSTWQAFWAHVKETTPAAEVARRLGISVEAVYAARYRVLRRLREELDAFLA
jgi:RNA polymerase sigma-70 factor (ECF subfamily)